LLYFADHGRQSVFAGLDESKQAEKPQGDEWFDKKAVKGEKKKSRQIAKALERFLPEDNAEMATDPTDEGAGVVSPRSTTTDLQESDADKKPSAKDQAGTEKKGVPEDNVAAVVSPSAAPNAEDATAATTTTSVEAATADETTDADMGDSAAAIANEAMQSPGDDDGEKNITKRRRVEK
jgi:hypothetical protein